MKTILFYTSILIILFTSCDENKVESINENSTQEQDYSNFIFNNKKYIFKQNEVFWYIGIKGKYPYSSQDTIHQHLFVKTNIVLEENGIDKIEYTTGFSRTLTQSKDSFQMEYGQFIHDSLTVPAPFYVAKLDTGYYAYVVQRGDYYSLSTTKKEFEKQLVRDQITTITAPFEIYYRDPSNESNSENWETELRYPIIKP